MGSTGEALLIAALLAASILPLALRAGRGRAALISLGIFVVGSVVLAVVPRPPVDAELAVENRPIQVPAEGYVQSRACQSCHPREYATWHRSYHRTMTQVATPESVIGPFDRVLQYDGRTYELQREGDEFWVRMQDPDIAAPGAPIVRRRIVMTTGSHHMQVYWYATEHTRMLGQLPFIWLEREQRWIPRVSAFVAPPIRGPETGRWNLVCIKCHATAGKQRLDHETSAFDTRAVEMGIACEACHGPAGEHVARYGDPGRRYGARLAGDAEDIVDPQELIAERSAEVCGQCHGIHYFYDQQAIDDWNDHGFRYRPGDDLAETKLIVDHDPALGGSEMPRLLEAYPQYDKRDRFWSDGMVRVSGREFSGVMRSPCYQGKQFSCLSCHTLHPDGDDPRSLDEWADDQLTHGREGDEACLQCHDDFRAKVVEHGRHEPGSTGNECMNCHMPYTTYGLLKAIRSHQVDSPDVRASIDTGRPNACNQCHLDRSLGWTADYLKSWYGIEPPPLTDDEATVAASVLWALRGDPGQRALMAWSMGWDAAREASGEDWMPPYLAQLLVDRYDAVRFIAGRTLAGQPGYEDFAYDFLDEESVRNAASLRLVETWRRQAPSLSPERAAPLLLEPGAGIDVETIRRLLADRDDRPLTLKE